MIDEDAVTACADLVGRAGGESFEIGYVNDDVPVEEAGWFATAYFRGVRVIVDDQPDPSEACDALAMQLLVGGQCTHCRKEVSVYRKAPTLCRWYREGPEWKRGCE